MDLKQVKIVVFAGGGIRGISYLGVLKAFEELNIIGRIKCFAGSSFGAIIAALLSVGYTFGELYSKVFRVNKEDLQNIRFLDLYSKWGVDDGDKIEEILESAISEATGISFCTFKQLYDKKNKTLVVVTTCLETRSTVLLSHRTCSLAISKALRMSISLPFVLTPVKYKNRTFVDGGLINNFPIKYFPIRQTLGVRMLSNTNHIHREISSIAEYAHSIWSCVYGEMNKLKRDGVCSYRVTEICTSDFSTFDFDLSKHDIKSLIIQGFKCMMKEFTKNKTNYVGDIGEIDE